MGELQLNNFDDLQTRSRFMQVEGQAPFKPLDNIPDYSSKPSLVGTVDTISTAKASDNKYISTSHNPTLPPSDTILWVYKLLEGLQDFGTTQKRELEQDHQKITNENLKLEEVHRQKLENFQKRAKQISQSNTWGVLRNISTYVATTSSVVSGSLLLGTSAATTGGVLLVASGVIGLTGKILSETGLLEKVSTWFTNSKEKAQTIQSTLENGFFITSTGLGLFGGFQTISAGAASKLTGNLTFQQYLARASAFAGSTITATATLGKGITEKKIQDTEVKYLETKKEEHGFRSLMRRVLNKMNDLTRWRTNIFQIAKDFISKPYVRN